MNQEPKKGAISPLVAVAIIVGAGAFALIRSRATHERFEREAVDGTPYGAFMAARPFVERKLVSPGSAEFASYQDKASSTTQVGGSTWRVRSWVDSQNGFGALIRTNYTCTLRCKGDGTWALESLETQ